MASEKPDIGYLTRLARMELSDAEKAALGKDFEAIIGYIEVLSNINTGGVEPMEHVLGLSNVMRSDEVEPPFAREKLLSCAPNAEDGFYDVPLAVEQEG